MNTQTDSKYHPPSDYCGGSNPINVEFLGPNDRQSDLSNSMTIKVRVDSTNDIALLELEIDGNKVRSFSGPPYEYNANLSDGVHRIKAIAHDSKNNQSDREITIGVHVAWDYTPSPSPSPEPTPI
jgi:hypothetical protein